MKKIIFLLIFIISSFSAFSEISDSALVQNPEKKSIIDKVENWYENNMNYGSIVMLMTVESSFVPFPSEVVIPPAAYIASKPDSKLNIFLVVLFGTLGAIIGAYINYFLALWLGRPIMYKFADSRIGKLLMLSSEKIQKAEKYFNDNGKVSTFVGRLIPGIRQFISVPAGLARMNLASFTLYTALGATIWNGVLALLGYIFHENMDMINRFSHEIGLIILIIVVLVAAFYIFKFFNLKKKK